MARIIGRNATLSIGGVEMVGMMDPAPMAGELETKRTVGDQRGDLARMCGTITMEPIVWRERDTVSGCCGYPVSKLAGCVCARCKQACEEWGQVRYRAGWMMP